MMLTDLAVALRNGGVTVIEQTSPNWKSHGHGQMARPVGVLCHHTAGPRSGNTPSLGVVTNGRAGLAGPLCNLYLARDGTWVTIAAGVGWHAGTGGLPYCPANQGNQYLIGIEAESSGVGGDWTPAQLLSYPKGVAALCNHYNLGANRVAGHKEYTSRKIDPQGWPGDMAGFRNQVQHFMTNGFVSEPEPEPRKPPAIADEDEMIIRCGDQMAYSNGAMLVHVGGSAGEKAAVTDLIERQGGLQLWVDEVTWKRMFAIVAAITGIEPAVLALGATGSTRDVGK